MSTLLRIDSSARLTGSHSRKMGDLFTAEWRAQNPGTNILTRDLARDPIEQIRQETIAGFYTPAEAMTPELVAATALSDQLIAEVQSAELLLITVPLYNFGIPSSLKAWIDQVTRIGQTFSYDGSSFSGLVNCDTAVVCATYGASGYEEGGPFRAANFLEPYLGFLLGFLGISTVKFVTLQATTGDEQTVQAGMAQAESDIQNLVTDLSNA